MPDVFAIYGFGSHFKGRDGNDIDLLVVSSENCKDTVALYRRLVAILSCILKRPHLTVFTRREFQNRPLLEHDTMIFIAGIDDRKMQKSAGA